MGEYLAVLASLFFAFSHILIRRALVTSNPITGSIVSVTISMVALWTVVPFFMPISSFLSPVVGYFILGGIFAPGLGRTLNYLSISRMGVSRAIPVVNSAPIFASILAVIFIGEVWPPQNIIGTSFIVVGVIIISSRGEKERMQWRRADLIYPIMAAMAFAVAGTFRKLGLTVENVPLLAATVSSTTSFLFISSVVQFQGGIRIIKLSRNSIGWFLAAGTTNTTAMLLTFNALSHGKLVIVEPLISTNPVLTILLTAIFLRDLEVVTYRVAIGACFTVVGTSLLLLL